MTTIRMASLAVLAIVMLGVAAPITVTAIDSSTCRVRNVTQDTVGRRLGPMVKAAVDGDHLRVRGTCTGGFWIVADITISGVGDRPVITGRYRHTVLRISRRATVTIRSIEIRRGGPGRGTGDGGGGIWVHGTLVLEDSVVTQNRDTGVTNWGGDVTIRRTSVRRNRGGPPGGGGVLSVDNYFTGATTVLVDSVVRDNVAYSGGGVIFTDGVLRLVRTRIEGNRATTEGGGILIITEHGANTVEIIDSVIRGNRAGTRGGGISNWDQLTVRSSTITGNVAGRTGGGIFNHRFGSVTLVDGSSVTGNTSDDCAGTPAC